MVPAEGLLTAHARNWEMIDSALEGLEDLDLVRQPDPQCNSIAWILWHMSRVVDTFIHTRLQDRPQLWIQDGWHQRFGMAADPEDRGVGWTAQQVCDWKPPARDVQVAYYQAVRDRARQFMSSLTQAQLEEERVIPPVAEPRTVAAALGQMTWDAVAHGGQIAYLRGLYRGMGWHR
jgi:uncharacterized damage-inducible protein DinB